MLLLLWRFSHLESESSKPASTGRHLQLFLGALDGLKCGVSLNLVAWVLDRDSTRQRAEDDREFSAAAADGFADHLHGDAGGTCYLKISILI